MKKRSIAQAFLMVTQLAISVMTPIILMTLLGMWLHNRFGWPSWVTVLLLFAGIIAGGREAYALAMGIVRADERARKKEEAERLGREPYDEIKALQGTASWDDGDEEDEG